jgi:hypothetical protein
MLQPLKLRYAAFRPIFTRGLLRRPNPEPLPDPLADWVLFGGTWNDDKVWRDDVSLSEA